MTHIARLFVWISSEESIFFAVSQLSGGSIPAAYGFFLAYFALGRS